MEFTINISNEELAKSLSAEKKGFTKEYKINPLSVMTMAKSGDFYAKQETKLKKEDGSFMTIEEVNNTLLSKAIGDFSAELQSLTNFNPWNEIRGYQAEQMIELMFDKSDFYKQMTTVYGNERTIPIVGYTAETEALVSPERVGSQGSEIETIAKSSFEMFTHQVARQFNIYMKDVANNLYNPNFVQNIINRVNMEKANDFLRLATNGVSDAGGTSKADFYKNGKGIVYLGRTLNGSYTNSNNSSVFFGRLGKEHTPRKVDSVSTTTASYANLVAIFDKLILSLDPEDRNNPDFKFVVGPDDAEIYRMGRGGRTNVYQEELLTNGNLVNYRGHGFTVNYFLTSVFSPTAAFSGVTLPGAVFLARPSDFAIGWQRVVEQSSKFEPRPSNGAARWEHDDIYYVDFNILNRKKVAIASAGLKVETPVATNGNGLKQDKVTSGASGLEVYPYCDTVGARIFYADATNKLDDLADAVANGTEVTEGTKVTLTATTYFRAFKDGFLDDSDILTVPIA